MDNKLEHMFELQNQLQNKLGTWDKMKKFHDKPEICPAKKQQFINQTLLACHEEVTEIMRETAYKNPDYMLFGWKKGQESNEEKMKEEIVDLMHFVMNLSLVAGMDAKEFYEIYCKKNNINVERKNNGY